MPSLILSVHVRELWFSLWNHLFSIIKLPPYYKGFYKSKTSLYTDMYDSENQDNHFSFYFEEVATTRRHREFEPEWYQNAIAVLTYGLHLRFLKVFSCSFSSKKHGLRVVCL